MLVGGFEDNFVTPPRTWLAKWCLGLLAAMDLVALGYLVVQALR